MATLESLVLDSLALNDRTNFILQGFDPGIPPKRWQWISGIDSDGSVLVEEANFDNAEMTLRIRVAPQATMDLALAKIGQIVDKLQECEQQADQGGLAMVWTPAGSTKTLTAYILGGEVTGIPMALTGDTAGWFLRNPAPVVTIKLYRRPFLYGTEVVSAATVTNTLPYQVLTVANVTGDVPAEARLVVTDGATQNRRLVRWGRRWRYYDAATSLYIDSDNMVVTGFAGAQTTRTGAHDPNAAGNNVIRATLTTTPVAICGLGNLGHVGSYRPVLRCYAAPLSASINTDFKVRLSYREGDGPLQALPWVSPTVVNGFSEAEMGVINIPPKTLGTQRWTGQIEAYSGVAGDTLDVDYVLLFPTDAYSKARVVQRFETPTAFTARDEFDQTAGALNAKTLPVGGTWATSGVGAVTDLAVEATGHTAQRSATADTGPRFAIAGASVLTDSVVQCDFKLDTTSNGSVASAVIARWTDSANYLYANAFYGGSVYGTPCTALWISALVAGAPVSVAAKVLPQISAGAWYSLRLAVTATGAASAWLFPRGATPSATPDARGSHAATATGGTLASGKIGFLDENSAVTATTRNYDNFFAFAPTPDAVVFSGRSCEINSQKAERFDSTGTYSGPIQTYRGARFYLQPAGDENRTNEILVETRRNDTDLFADDQIADSTTVTIHYTPRWSTVPR